MVVTRRNFCGFSRLGVGVVDVDVYSASGKGPAIIFSKKADGCVTVCVFFVFLLKGRVEEA